MTSFNVELELTHDGFQDVGFPVRDVLVDNQVYDSAVLEDNLEGLLVNVEVLPGELGFLDVRVPASGKFLVDLSVLHILQDGDSALDLIGLFLAFADDEFSFQKGSGELLGQILKTGEGPAFDPVFIFGALAEVNVFAGGKGNCKN